MTYPLNRFNSDEGVQTRTGLMRFAGEITLLAGFGALVFIVLALLSYSPQDAAWSTSGSAAGALHNRAGRAGAWVADVAYALMGYSAWWCVAAAAFAWALGLASWMRGNARGRGQQAGLSWWAFWLGLALLLLTSCGLEWTRLHRWDGALPGSAGGVLGHVSGRLAVQWLGYTGSTLLELAALACALALVFRFSWGRLAERIGALAYTTVAGQSHYFGRVRDVWAGARAARARARAIDQERVAVQESVISSLAPLTPLAPQPGAANMPLGGNGRVEPAFDGQVDRAAAQPAQRASWSEAVQPESVTLPAFLQDAQPAPRDRSGVEQAGGQAQRRGWLSAALAPVFGKKAAPQFERIEPGMDVPGASMSGWSLQEEPAAWSEPQLAPQQDAAARGSAWVPTSQMEPQPVRAAQFEQSRPPQQQGQARPARAEAPLGGEAGQSAAARQEAAVVQAARAALAARASRRIDAREQEETAQERAWAAAAAAYAPQARRRQQQEGEAGAEATPLPAQQPGWGEAPHDAAAQEFDDYDDYYDEDFEDGAGTDASRSRLEDEGEEAVSAFIVSRAAGAAADGEEGAAQFTPEFVVSSFNPVRQSGLDADAVGSEEELSFPPLDGMSVLEQQEEDEGGSSAFGAEAQQAPAEAAGWGAVSFGDFGQLAQAPAAQPEPAFEGSAHAADDEYAGDECASAYDDGADEALPPLPPLEPLAGAARGHDAPLQPAWARPQQEDAALRPAPSQQQPAFGAAGAVAVREFSGPLPMPQLDLLDAAVSQGEAVTPETLEMTSRLIEKKLKDFGVNVRVVEAAPGPVITRYEIEPAPGVKGSRIVNLAKDLARSLSLVSIRVVETIPGKNCMALELPNTRRQTIRLTEVLDSDAYRDAKSVLTVGLGKDIIGRPVVADLAKMPHVLVAGTTGSGKSVGINAMILSLLYKADPKDVRLMLIDPKMLEMSVYEGIPHLLCPVVTDMRQAANGLHWCVEEMERRYRLMSRMGVRNLAGFNAKILEADARGETISNPFSLTPEAPEPLDELPSIVVVIDELADLMMSAGKKIEELIARLAQKARAAGIYLVLATQRPSTDVLTGLIRANIPTRMSFKVASLIDSRIILDCTGAETLLGNGDMLYKPNGGIAQRVHGAFVSDDEVHRVANFLREHSVPNYIDGVLEGGSVDGDDGGAAAGEGDEGGEQDPMYDQAVEVVLRTRRASISWVQRQLRIGYGRAARLLDDMERAGVVSAMDERSQREILVPERAED